MAELCVGTCGKGVGTLELGQGEGRGNREGEFFPSSMIWKDIQNGQALCQQVPRQDLTWSPACW